MKGTEESAPEAITHKPTAGANSGFSVSSLFTGEKLIWIDLPDTDELRIQGILQGSLDKPVAILVHGKPGWPNGFEHTQTGEYFNSRGITCLRLYMYGNDAGYRDLADCTLETYTHDFEAVVAYLRAQNVPKLFGVGHSYGGLAILNANVALDAVVLWDPTHGSYWTRHPRMQKSADEPLTEYETMGDTTALAAHKGYPLKIISAGRGKMKQFHERYMAVADEPKSHSVIEGAQHSLGNSLQILAEVRKQTADWLTQFM